MGLPKDHLAKISSHFEQYYNNGNVEDIDIPFRRVIGSYQGVYKATDRYFIEDVTREQLPDWFDFNGAMQLMKDIFTAYRGQCAPFHLDDTHINAKSAIGYHLRQFSKDNNLGWRCKGDVYNSCPNLCVWYKKYAHIYKIPVLWDTSGKAEILKSKKALIGDIRTFTFTDPFFTLKYSNLISAFKSLVMINANDFVHSPIRMGVSFVRGCFNAMMKQLDDMIVVKGDCIKWDASYSTVLNDATRLLIAWALECEEGDDMYEELCYCFHQCFKSYVRMPGSEVYEILKKKSGDPNTTIGNSLGHLFILCAHLVYCAKQLQLQPYVLWLKTRWNIYADDHLNGYPPIMKQFCSFEHRAKFYRAVGVNLHPPPEDVVQLGPVGTSFLGAEAVKEYGKYVPQYNWLRLLAIFQCNSYSGDELAEVITSISPLLNSSPKAIYHIRKYLRSNFPELVPLLNINRELFSGLE